MFSDFCYRFVLAKHAIIDGQSVRIETFKNHYFNSLHVYKILSFFIPSPFSFIMASVYVGISATDKCA